MPKKSAVLACLTMAKLKMNQHVTNKNADLLKKNQLNGNRECQVACKFYNLYLLPKSALHKHQTFLQFGHSCL